MAPFEAQVGDGQLLLEEGARNLAVDEAHAELSLEDEDDLIARLAAADRGAVVAYDSIDAMIHDLCQ